MEIGVKEARSKFSSLLDLVEEGKEIIIRRRGKEVARLAPPRGGEKALPSLKNFRKSLRIKGERLSKTVSRNREAERY